MTARKTHPSSVGTRRPRKSLKPPVKKSRLRLSLKLTRAEIKKLQQRAAADMRSISGYVAFLVTEELRRRGRTRRATGVFGKEKRFAYDVAVPLTGC